MARTKTHDQTMRQKLLDAATERVATHGEHFGLRTLADSQGTSTTAIYSLFGSRGKLLEAVAERAITRFTEAVKGIEDDDPVLALISLAVKLRIWARSSPSMYDVAFSTSVNSPRVRALRAEARQPLLRLVERVAEQGFIDSPPPLPHLANTLYAAAHGFIKLEQLGEISGGERAYLVMLGHLFDAFTNEAAREHVQNGPIANTSFVQFLNRESGSTGRGWSDPTSHRPTPPPPQTVLMTRFSR